MREARSDAQGGVRATRETYRTARHALCTQGGREPPRQRVQLCVRRCLPRRRAHGIGRRDIPDAAKRDVEIAKVEIDVEVEITTGEAIRPVAPQAPSGMAEREVV